MKKTYIQPVLEAVNVHNEAIIATSTFSINSDNNGYTSSDFAAKERVFFGDEEVEW